MSVWVAYAGAIVINLILFFGIKYIWKRNQDEEILNVTIDSYTDSLLLFNRFWRNAGMINVLVWIVIIVGTIVFHSGGSYQEQVDVGSSVTKAEIAETVSASQEDVDNANTISLTVKEIARDKEIQEAQKKSRDEFKDFLDSAK